MGWIAEIPVQWLSAVIILLNAGQLVAMIVIYFKNKHRDRF